MIEDEFTLAEFYLDVGDGHQIYVQDWGNQHTKTPIIYLHGGPGNGCGQHDKQRFNPAVNRVIFFDQRGSGRSLPVAELKHNNTQALIGDIDKLADKLKLTSFALVGGSWGSTLALCYAIHAPNRVHSLIIDGIFLANKADKDWLGNGGWRDFFPDKWQAYSDSVPAAYKDKPTDYYFRQIKSDDPETLKRAAYEYSKMEIGLLRLDESYSSGSLADFDPTASLIEMHYLSNDCFLEDNYILKRADQLALPVHIIQGRYDMVCRPQNAYLLAQTAPQANLIWSIGGHSKQHEASTIQRLLIGRLDG